MAAGKDAQAIAEIGERYYQAMVTADEVILRDLFDARASIVGYFHGEYLWFSLQDFIDETISYVGRHGTESCRVESLCVDGDIAFVAVGGQYAQLWMVDHLLLSRVGDGWKIVSKTFHVVS